MPKDFIQPLPELEPELEERIKNLTPDEPKDFDPEELKPPPPILPIRPGGEDDTERVGKERERVRLLRKADITTVRYL